MMSCTLRGTASLESRSSRSRRTGLVQEWLSRAEAEESAKPGLTRTEAAEVRELRKRNRLLDQENEVLLKAAAYLS